MTIDIDYHVDPSLARVDTATLMSRAFEFTHRIHEANHPHDAGLRDQREAIVREMRRRSDMLDRALVVIESTERLMGHVVVDINDAASPFESLLASNFGAKALSEAIARTSDFTCTAVKNQDASDEIAAKAREIVRPIVDAARA